MLCLIEIYITRIQNASVLTPITKSSVAYQLNSNGSLVNVPMS